MTVSEPQVAPAPPEPFAEGPPPRRERTSLARARRWAAEFVVVVLGVFVALVADRWQASAHDRELERAYVARLRSDVAADTTRLRMLIERAERKMEALRGIETLLARGPGKVGAAEAVDLLVRASASLEQDFVTVTMDELRGSASLLLIRSEAVRRAVVGYHEQIERYPPRIEARASEYPRVFREHLPPSVDRSSAEALAAAAAAWVPGMLADPRLPAAVNAEYHYAFYARRRFAVIQEDGQEALAALEEALR